MTHSPLRAAAATSSCSLLAWLSSVSPAPDLCARDVASGTVFPQGFANLKVPLACLWSTRPFPKSRRWLVALLWLRMELKGHLKAEYAIVRENSLQTARTRGWKPSAVLPGSTDVLCSSSLPCSMQVLDSPLSVGVCGWKRQLEPAARILTVSPGRGFFPLFLRQAECVILTVRKDRAQLLPGLHLLHSAPLQAMLCTGASRRRFSHPKELLLKTGRNCGRRHGT